MKRVPRRTERKNGQNVTGNVWRGNRGRKEGRLAEEQGIKK